MENPRSPMLAWTVAIAIVIAAAGCGSSAATQTAGRTGPASGTPASSRAARVVISNFSYRPSHLTVARGTRVTFTNRDRTPHTATSTTTAGFDTGTIEPGASRAVTLSKPGTYSYFCQFHAFMRAVVTVR
jgi:plastocyanin